VASLGDSLACVWVSPSVPKDCIPCLRAIALPLIKPDVQICPHPAFVIGLRCRVSQSPTSPSFLRWAASVVPLGTRQGRWLRRRRCFITRFSTCQLIFCMAAPQCHLP
jgi:hypothetical protein